MVTSKSGGSRFESGLCQFLNISHFCIHYKNKEKESWNGPSKIKGRSLGCVLKEHLTKMKWSSLNWRENRLACFNNELIFKLKCLRKWWKIYCGHALQYSMIQTKELFRLVYCQLSNKFGYCPWRTVSIVLTFHKHNSFPLGPIRAFHLHPLKIFMFKPENTPFTLNGKQHWIRLISCLCGLDYTKQVNLLLIQHNQSSWIKTSKTGG